MKGLAALTVVTVAIVASVYAVAPTPTAEGGVTLTVTRTDDPAPDGCQPGDCSIREAVIAANGDPAQDTITIPAGDYLLQIPGVAEDTGLSGDIDILEAVVIQGAGPDETVIDAQQLDRIFDVPVVEEPLKSVSLVGLTVTNGLPPSGGDGGGIRAIADLTLTNVHATDSSGDFGGGLVLMGGEVAISNSVFSGNSAFSGGGVSTFSGTEATVTDTLFTGNSAGNGGGASFVGPVFVEDSEFSLNTASFGAGGVLSYGGNFNPAGSDFRRIKVHDNSATNRGGGMELSGTNRIYESVVYDNHAGSHGGGIYNGSANTRLVNVTISGNTSNGFGGGFANGSVAVGSVGISGGLPDTVMYHVTVSNNTADADNNGSGVGGGIVNATSEIDIKSTIVSGNHSPNGDPDCFGEFRLDDRNVIGETSAGCILGGTTGDLLDIDPMLGSLANNGGATLTHALLAGSPAIDEGTECPPPTIDQRDATRPFGVDCDLGAYEFGAIPPIPAETPTPTPAPGDEVIWGDNNCSGQADPIDSLITLRFDAGLSANTGDCPEMGQVVEVADASPHPWGDADCSGQADPVDSLKLLRFDAGLSVAQAENCPGIGSTVTVSES